MYFCCMLYHVSCVSDRIVEKSADAQNAWEGELGSQTSEAFNKVLGMFTLRESNMASWEIPLLNGHSINEKHRWWTFHCHV